MNNHWAFATRLTREQAIKELSKTSVLTTAMLKSLNISFDSFLQFAQLPDQKAKEVISKLIAHFANR
ncbi:hypothetical protein LCGC14_1596890 [marine sediment metagenome]|uniref:Uncharacterized protein n=1 Tax=marine sediment metagenome TaxID=412755 RepID=A0A0F9KSY5_9ZZZZ